MGRGSTERSESVRSGILHRDRGPSLQVDVCGDFLGVPHVGPVNPRHCAQRSPLLRPLEACVGGILGSVTARARTGKSSGRTCATGKACCGSVLARTSLLSPNCPQNLSLGTCVKRGRLGVQVRPAGLAPCQGHAAARGTEIWEVARGHTHANPKYRAYCCFSAGPTSHLSFHCSLLGTLGGSCQRVASPGLPCCWLGSARVGPGSPRGAVGWGQERHLPASPADAGGHSLALRLIS